MPTILGANEIKDTGYNVSNSLRVDDASNDYLQRSISSAGSGTIWTASAWFKRSVLGQSASIYCSSDTSTNHNFRCLFINADDRVQCGFYNGGYTFQVEPTQLLRDMSAWYHIVAAVDSTQSTAADRVKIYINGVLQTDFSTASYPNQNASNNFAGTDIKQLVSSLRSGSSIHNSGYIAELHVLDGVVKQASDFGEYDEDSPQIWKPKEYDGTYGTNGFYMEFKQNGTSQNSSGLGADTSGNDNHFSVHNLTAVDQSTDTCTNNFATMNPLFARSNNVTFTEGNLKGALASEGNQIIASTIAVSAGKWYFEFQANSQAASAYMEVGIFPTYHTTVTPNYIGGLSDGYSLQKNGYFYNNNSAVATDGPTYGTSDIMGVAVDLDSAQKTIKYYKAGSLEDTYNITVTEDIYMGWRGFANAEALSMNFGSPKDSISSGNADGNGYGNFEYAVPSGYYALCTKNLAEYG